ncbi:MAG: hypothetical protein LC679_18410 [Intrasporangiaceae bacterium]|nr:hypothetical protein [Intrasporangiaceae bacterium]
MGRDEQEAAYFTLLRAREELDDIRRYGEYLAEAVEARLAVIVDEQRGLPDREAAADAFVTECEQEYASLQRGS